MATHLTGADPAFVLAIDGEAVGDLASITGLEMRADIVANDLGPDNIQKKHVSNVRWAPGVVTLGMGMGKAMASWLGTSFATGAATTNGTITLADANGRAELGINFVNALITRCSLPGLDAASTEAGALVVEFMPEQVRVGKGDGSDLRGRKNEPPKPWLRSGFRVEIGNLPCEGVLRVEPMSWTCEVAPDQVGIFREPTKHPAKVTVPDLKLTIRAADRQAWADAAHSWFVDGQHLEANELQGAITLVASDGSILGKLELQHLGFAGFETLSAISDHPEEFIVSLYVEAWSFQVQT